VVELVTDWQVFFHVDFLDGIASPASFVIMTFDFAEDQLLHFDKRRFSQFCTV